MSDRPTDSSPALDIDWLKTLAGALAAVTTAVLLSTLGAVGTLLGAALGSVAATVGSALYAQGLRRSRQAVLKAQEAALHKVGVAQAEVRRAARRDGAQQEAHLELADERLGEAREELDVEPSQTWGDRLAALPWRRIALVAAATFAVVVLAITAFEALAGRSVSSYTGGSDDRSTTIGGVTQGNGGGVKQEHKDDQAPQPSQSASPSEEPSEDVSESPTDSPSETPTETPTPTDTPAPTETSLPTTVPTPTP